MNRSKEIANTIWTQMKYMDSNLIMCMGVQKLAVIENGLQFKVNGLSFKGLVQITLNGGDLYDVKFIKVSRKLNDIGKEFGIKTYSKITTVVSESNDVFFDGLMELLEEKVENRSK